MPKEFEVRFWKFSPTNGWGVKVVHQCTNEKGEPLSGVYTAVTPKLGISTIDLSARSAVSVAPRAGVNYAPPPSLDNAAKERARKKSREVISKGVIAAQMGAYRAPGKEWALLYKIFRVMYSMPMAIFSVLAWAYGSYVNMLLLGCFTAATYRFVDVSGASEHVATALGFIRHAYETVKHFVEGTTAEVSTYEAWVQEFIEWSGWDLTSGDLTILLVGIAALLFMLHINWTDIKEFVLGILRTPSNSNNSSGADTPIFDGTELPPGIQHLPLSPTTQGEVGGLSPSETMLMTQLAALARSQEGIISRIERIDTTSNTDAATVGLNNAHRALENIIGRPLQTVPAMPSFSPMSDPGRSHSLLPAFHERINEAEAVLQADRDERGSKSRARSADVRGPPNSPSAEIVPFSQSSFDAGAGVELPKHVADKIQEVMRLAINPWDVFLEDMKLYRDVANWPFPDGYLERMFGVVGAITWGRGLTMVEFTKKFLVDTGGWEVPLVRNDMMTPAQTMDGFLLVEKSSLVNSPEAEANARQWLGNYQALSDCTTVNHIRKPSNAGKDWKSKFNWELYHRINPRGKKTGPALRIKPLENEINASRNADATYENLRQRLEVMHMAADPINS